MSLDVVTFGEVMTMFVATEPGPLGGSPPSPVAWPAPRPTSPPASAASATGPAGSAGSGTTPSAATRLPSWTQPAST